MINEHPKTICRIWHGVGHVKYKCHVIFTVWQSMKKHQDEIKDYPSTAAKVKRIHVKSLKIKIVHLFTIIDNKLSWHSFLAVSVRILFFSVHTSYPNSVLSKWVHRSFRKWKKHSIRYLIEIHISVSFHFLVFPGSALLPTHYIIRVTQETQSPYNHFLFYEKIKPTVPLRKLTGCFKILTNSWCLRSFQNFQSNQNYKFKSAVGADQ